MDCFCQPDTKSDSEGVHHGVGVIIVSLKRKSRVKCIKLLELLKVSENDHLAVVGVNCLNE